MFQRIDVQTAAQIIGEQDAHIVDVRDPNSFAQGHIKNAIHLDNNSVPAFIADSDKTKPVVVICYKGNASQSAADFLNQQGFTQTYSVDGGMGEWAHSQEVVSD
jgi:thiosulfate sulfurtransferase